jgi:hypothetical protein
MDTARRTAIIVGVLYIIGTVAGVLSVVFSQPVLTEPDYLSRIAADPNSIIFASLLVLTMGLALALIPVVLYPVTRRFSEVLALGYVVFRGALEPIAYLGAVVAWLALIPLSQEYVGATAVDASFLQSMAAVLLGVNGALSNYILVIIFSLGALMLYALLYRSRLVPRWLSVWGLIAILMHFSTAFLMMFGLLDENSTLTSLINLPIFLQEMVMALWLIVKGFNPDALQKGDARSG